MKYYTVKDAGEYLRVSQKTIHRRRGEGQYPHARKNGKWIIPQCCLDNHPDGEAPVLAASNETEGPQEPTALEKLRERKAELAVREEILRLESEIEKYTEQQTILIDLTLQERDLLDQCIETSAELFDQDSRLQRKIATDRTLVRHTIPAAQAEAAEITTKAEAVAEGIITKARTKADSLVAAAKPKPEPKRKAAPVAVQSVVKQDTPSEVVFRGSGEPWDAGKGNGELWIVGALVFIIVGVVAWLVFSC